MADIVQIEQGRWDPCGAIDMANPRFMATFAWQDAAEWPSSTPKNNQLLPTGSSESTLSLLTSGADGQEIDCGKYIVIWKQEIGAWRLHWDIRKSTVAPHH